MGQAGCLLPLPVFPDCLGWALSHRLPAPLSPTASKCPTSPLFSLPFVLRGLPSQATETPLSPRDVILYHRTNCVHLIENHIKFDRVPSYHPLTEFCRKQIRNRSLAAPDLGASSVLPPLSSGRGPSGEGVCQALQGSLDLAAGAACPVSSSHWAGGRNWWLLSFPHPEAPWLRNVAMMPLACFGGGTCSCLGPSLRQRGQ